MEGDPRQEQEWLRQSNLIYGALIAIGVFMVQPFLTAPSLDLAAEICVIAFSVAIPLLAALVLVNQQEVFRGRRTPSVIVTVAQSVAQAAAFVGLVAGFWHIHWIAGVTVLSSGIVAVGVHSAGWWRLELEAGISDERLAFYDELIADHPGIERGGKPMPFTSANGNMFSFLAPDGTLAIRLSDEDRARFIEEGGATRTEQHGRAMKEYVDVPDGMESDDLRAWFATSVEYARGLRTRPTKRAKR